MGAQRRDGGAPNAGTRLVSVGLRGECFGAGVDLAEVLEPAGEVDRRVGQTFGTTSGEQGDHGVLVVGPGSRVTHHHLVELSPSGPASNGPNEAPSGSST